MNSLRISSAPAIGRRAFATCALAIAGTALAGTQAQQPATMQYDLAHRSSAIHWPDGFDPASADLFSHNEMKIYASCERVWEFIVRAPAWPGWYPNATDVHLLSEGTKELTASSVFRWATFGPSIEPVRAHSALWPNRTLQRR